MKKTNLDDIQKLAGLTEKTNAFQRGFNSVQQGNKFGPDAAERFVKGLFTGGGDDSKPDDGADTGAGKEKSASKQPAAKAKSAPKQPASKVEPAPKKEIPFPKSKEGVQLKPGDKVTYTNQRGKQQNAVVNKMLKTKDKHGDLQIQLKMGSVTFAIDRDNISAANGKPWTFDPTTRRGTAEALELNILAITKDL